MGNDQGKEVHGKGMLQEEKTEESQTCKVQSMQITKSGYQAGCLKVLNRRGAEK